MKKRAFFGGTFDPVHNGHIAIAHTLLDQFDLDEFVFIPAFHAPHKSRLKPTSAYDRYAMLCLATEDDERIRVSQLEYETPDEPYSVQTLPKLNAMYPDDRIFFIMGADSWMDILTWREWEKVLSLTDHIVVTRPGREIAADHVTEEIRSRIVDLTGPGGKQFADIGNPAKHIYLTDRVNIDISATDIRHRARNGDDSWKNDVPPGVAKFIEKYQIYK
ncbi:MAG: nicotinate (nicotinamide) nucleotide adenylyltransferase [Acidobacteriota bacterium]|nr:MAG: nicotinate (nicotinamide) nucleotide adenylyltransferase [Acidobacteriota bacterium]